MSISKEKKLIEHKCIIFFNYLDIKRLPSCEHILIVVIFIYNFGYMQTIINMYFYVITEINLPTIGYDENKKIIS